jgi:hypothetical protein
LYKGVSSHKKGSSATSDPYNMPIKIYIRKLTARLGREDVSGRDFWGASVRLLVQGLTEISVIEISNYRVQYRI